MIIEQDKNSQRLLARVFSGTTTSEDVSLVARRLAVIAADTQQVLSSTESANVIENTEQWAIGVAQSLAFGLSSPEISERLGALWLLAISHPELVLPTGFDEVRYAAQEINDHTLSESVRGVFDEVMSEWPSEVPPSGIGIEVLRRSHYRTPDGMWHGIEGVFDRLLPPQIERGEGERRSGAEWYKLLSDEWFRKIGNCALTSPKVVTLPSLILPTHHESQLHSATKSILCELHQNKTSLAELHWRTLEEIVAELLCGMGLKVALTKRSSDGGRDVIARGELIPGEPILLAVEVKHKNVVGVRDLREALWANRHFPALLFATSGRFSAGVYREKIALETSLRLILKDGGGLEQWIDQYVRQSFDAVLGHRRGLG